MADPAVCQALIGSLTAARTSPGCASISSTRAGSSDARRHPKTSARTSRTIPEVITARADGHASRGEYAWGLFSVRPALPWRRPGTGQTGRAGLSQVVARLDPFVRTLRTLLPEGYAAMVADRGGRVVAVEPADANVIGRELPPSLAPLALLPEPAQTVARWTDGSERLIAYSPAASSQGVFFSVGVRKADVMADVWAFAYSAGLAPAIIAVVAFLLAWWGGIHFIRRPLGNLAEVALRWRDGDQSARVTLPGRSEIAGLGRVFNAMADAKDESDRQTREGAELLSALIDSSSDCIFVTDRDGRLMLANSTFLDVFDLARDAAVGHKLIVQGDHDAQQAMNILHGEGGQRHACRKPPISPCRRPTSQGGASCRRSAPRSSALPARCAPSPASVAM